MNLDEAIRQIEAKQTNGQNCDVTPEAIVAMLTAWSERCELEVTEVGEDRVAIEFRSLPPNLDRFCREVAAFCPDVIHQGFGVVMEMIEFQPELAELVEGLDPESEEFPYQVMARDLRQRRSLLLWWD